MLFYHWFYGELRGELGRELAAGLGPRRLVEALEEASSRARDFISTAMQVQMTSLLTSAVQTAKRSSNAIFAKRSRSLCSLPRKIEIACGTLANVVLLRSWRGAVATAHL